MLRAGKFYAMRVDRSYDALIKSFPRLVNLASFNGSAYLFHMQRCYPIIAVNIEVLKTTHQFKQCSYLEGIKCHILFLN